MEKFSKQKSDALEERNEITVFSSLEETGNAETTLFFAAVRQT